MTVPVDTVPARLRAARERYGDRVAMVAHGASVTFAELDDRAGALARRLLEHGCGKGTRVGVLFPNGIDWAVAFHAVARIGAVAVPINTFSTPRELHWVLRNADVDTLVMCATFRNHDYVAKLEQVVPELARADGPTPRLTALPYLRHVFVDADAAPVWASALERTGERGDAHAVGPALLAAVEEEVAPADLAVIIYTSGSTSTPKGVVHTHGTVVRKSAQIAALLELRCTDRFYTNMPFFWVGGLLQGVLACLHVGAALHCTPETDPGALLALLRAEGITRTVIFSPPLTVLRQHPDHRAEDFGGVRELARPRAPGALGMTETFGMHSSYAPGELGDPDGMGRATDGIERMIVDPATGDALARGHRGELVVRGRFLMEGYAKRERHEVVDADGWFHTGDECTIDDDGQLFWHGRLDDVIKRAGANVAPAEVEAVLLAVPGIAAAAVVGIDDSARGVRIVAVVEVDPDATVVTGEILAFLGRELASYKVPNDLVVVAPGTLPRSATGKIRKPGVRDLARRELERSAG